MALLGYAVLGAETRNADIPTTGDASYFGYSAIDILPAENLESYGDSIIRLRGNVELNVAFDDGKLSGEIRELTLQEPRSDVEDPYAGKILLGEAEFDVNGYKGSVRLDQAALTSFEAQQFDPESSYSGAFYGPNAEEASGTIGISGTSAEDGDYNGFGFFTTEKFEE